MFIIVIKILLINNRAKRGRLSSLPWRINGSGVDREAVKTEEREHMWSHKWNESPDKWEWSSTVLARRLLN